MNPDEMKRIMEQVKFQNYTYKVEFTGAARDQFMADMAAFQQEAAEEMLEATGLIEARMELSRIMAL